MGALKALSAVDLGVVVVKALLDRGSIPAEQVEEIIMGNVLSAGLGQNPARQVGLRAGLSPRVAALTVNKVCGSGLKAVGLAAQAVQLGEADLIVAGGMESMSNAPYLLKGARWGYRMGNGDAIDSMLNEGLTCAMGLTHMGITAEEVASRYNVSRADQDAFAAESQSRAVRAIAEGRFVDEIVPVPVPQRKGDPVPVAIDEFPRAGTTVEKLAALKPAFKKEGTVTAGNASGINDGAAALVVTTAAKARARGRKPLARILSYAITGVEPKVMGIGPVTAVRRALERAGLGTADIDLFELNEAFAAQSVAVARELAVDPAKVNVNGGAIALGHPIGASGARVLTTLLHALRARRLRHGVASLCIGGGMGIAMAVENLEL
jgi:acetyl-CoA C-acetyltransferase